MYKYKLTSIVLILFILVCCDKRITGYHEYNDVNITIKSVTFERETVRVYSVISIRTQSTVKFNIENIGKETIEYFTISIRLNFSNGPQQLCQKRMRYVIEPGETSDVLQISSDVPNDLEFLNATVSDFKIRY